MAAPIQFPAPHQGREMRIPSLSLRGGDDEPAMGSRFLFQRDPRLHAATGATYQRRPDTHHRRAVQRSRSQRHHPARRREAGYYGLRGELHVGPAAARTTRPI